MKKNRPTLGVTVYSSWVRGSWGNYHQKVRFDLADGYMGIDQPAPQDSVPGRILLSPAQVKTLLAFVKTNERK